MLGKRACVVACEWAGDSYEDDTARPQDFDDALDRKLVEGFIVLPVFLKVFECVGKGVSMGLWNLHRFLPPRR